MPHCRTCAALPHRCRNAAQMSHCRTDAALPHRCRTAAQMPHCRSDAALPHRCRTAAAAQMPHCRSAAQVPRSRTGAAATRGGRREASEKTTTPHMCRTAAQSHNMPDSSPSPDRDSAATFIRQRTYISDREGGGNHGTNTGTSTGMAQAQDRLMHMHRLIAAPSHCREHCHTAT